MQTSRRHSASSSTGLLTGWVAVLLLVFLLASCRADENEVTINNQNPSTQTVGGVQSIVTRIVEQIIIVTTTPGPAAVDEKPKERVTLDLSLNGQLPNLDPGIAQTESQLDLGQNLFVGLTNYNPDTHTIEPELALNWVLGADGRTWTFNLRDDVYWVRPARPRPGSDALWSATPIRPVTADDVVFAVQRLCGRDIESPLAFSLFLIEGCEQLFSILQPTDADRAAIGIRALDDTTLEIRLTKPAGYFLTLTSMPFFQPVPRDLVTELGDEWLNAIGEFGTGWQVPENLVTSGPFLPVSSELTSQHLVLHRNPLWPIDRSGNVDIVNIFFFTDNMDAYDLWQRRELDISPLPTSEREVFMQRSAGKARVLPDQVLFYLGFDFGSQVFREPEVRRAFSAAIDREQLLIELYNGRGIVMRHGSVPNVVAAIPTDEVGVGYSPDYARQQMAESTFRSCRLMPPVTLLVSSADLSLRQAEIIRDMWVEELGCPKENINIAQVQFGALLAGTRPEATGRPDMWELAWAPTFPDIHNVLTDLLHCQDSENRQNRECSEADTLLRRAGSAVDPTERTALYRQAESLFFNETGIFPIAPLYVRAREIIVHDWITFTPVAFGGQQWDRINLNASTKSLERSR